MTKYKNFQPSRAEMLAKELAYFGCRIDPLDLLGILGDLQLDLTSGLAARHAYEQTGRRPTKRIDGAEFPIDYDTGAPFACGDDRAVARAWPIEGREIEPYPPADGEEEE